MKLKQLAATALFSFSMTIGPHPVFADSPSDRWHVMSIDGTAVGSTHEAVREEESLTTTTETMVMVLNRMGSRIETGMVVTSHESVSGELTRVDLLVQSSAQAMEVVGFREGDQWITRSNTPGVPDQLRPLTEPLVGPQAVARLFAELDKPGDSVGYHAFVPTTMQPGEIRAELVGYERVDQQSLKVIEEHLPGVPVPMVRLVDDRGRNVITRMPGPFGLTETVLADQTAATLAQVGGELPDEVFEDTILKTGVRLPKPREIEYLELELKHRNPKLGWPVLDSAHQKVLSQTDDTVLLAVERRHPGQSVAIAASSGLDVNTFLGANAILQSAQPELLTLAKSLTADAADPWQAALALRRWVSDNMSFDAGVVLAPSSEVLVNRQGTCTEFAVLLTALSRAAGIPARYVQGYVYAHGMFAGHAWTEVLIGNEWLALDAAIPSAGAADAARFAFVWTGLEDGLGTLNAGASMQMFGQIDARVVAWRGGDGIERRFPSGAPVPTATVDRFTDAIQGIEWAMPEAWRVVDFQQTWPSNLIAAAEQEDGQRVELRWISQHPWERAGIDWIEPLRAEGAGVEATPLGRADSWLVQSGDGYRFVQAGHSGHWQLSGADRQQVLDLAAGLVLPGS